MTTFALVHGAFHGGWCWDRLVPALRKGGAKILSPDLAGMGQDPTPHAAVTFARWVDSVAGPIEQQGERVILVGHSLGGFIASGVAERCPDSVAATVYLSAMVPAPGKSIQDSSGFIGSRCDGVNKAPQEIAPGGVAMRLTDEADIGQIFYNTSSEDDVRFARSRLGWTPTRPFADPIALTSRNYGRVPRVFIECLQDNGLPLSVQRDLQKLYSFDRVFSLDCDHSPFFSRIDELAGVLKTIASSYD